MIPFFCFNGLIDFTYLPVILTRGIDMWRGAYYLNREVSLKKVLFFILHLAARIKLII
jgi:hypothetical protein